MRICSLDPGRIRDAFCMLVADVDEKSVKLLNTREWYNKDFYIVGKDISDIKAKVGIDMFLCETNNQGHPAIDTLRRFYDIDCRGIITARDVKSKEKLRTGNVMPKNITVEWVEWALQQGIIVFPQKPWPRGIKRLDEQMSQYVRRVSSSGMKYEAADTELHDVTGAQISARKFKTALDYEPISENEFEKEVRKRLSKKYPDTDSFEFNVRMPEQV